MCVCVDFYGALCRELLPSPAVTVTADTRQVAAKGAWPGGGAAVKAELSEAGGGARGRLMHTQLLTFVFCRKCVCECVQVCVCLCVCFVLIFCCCIFAVAAVDSRYLLLLLKLLCVLLSALPWSPAQLPPPPLGPTAAAAAADAFKAFAAYK